jgi:hypothetical protein
MAKLLNGLGQERSAVEKTKGILIKRQVTFQGLSCCFASWPEANFTSNFSSTRTSSLPSFVVKTGASVLPSLLTISKVLVSVGSA